MADSGRNVYTLGWRESRGKREGEDLLEVGDYLILEVILVFGIT